MPKLTLTDLSSLTNEATAIAAINANNTAIETALENTFSRDGTSPNEMSADLDMDSNRILNLPEPVNDTEPLRLGDTNVATLTEMEAFKDAAEAAQAAAELAQAAAETAETNAETAEANAETAETNAETAETNAEAAQLAAETAQSLAEAAQAAAEIAETNAETAETNAEAAQAAAEAARDAALVAETNAETAETNAETAQTAAETARDAALAAQADAEAAADNFDDVYLGSKSANPTLDNDGNPLVEGQLYWNSTTNALQIYDGAAWNAYSAASGLTSVADDATPQLGGDLDANSFNIGFDDATGIEDDSGNEQLIFQKTASAVNYLEITNAATGNGVTITATGDDTDVDLHLACKGSGSPKISNSSILAANAIGVLVQAFDAQLSSLVRQNSQSAAYTTVLTDGGKHILHPSSDNNARTFTIDSNANVAYPIGTVITFVNKINVVTIAITSDTLTWAGFGSTGSRSLAANGMATAIKIGTTEWMISGSGLS